MNIININRIPVGKLLHWTLYSSHNQRVCNCWIKCMFIYFYFILQNWNSALPTEHLLFSSSFHSLTSTVLLSVSKSLNTLEPHKTRIINCLFVTDVSHSVTSRFTHAVTYNSVSCFIRLNDVSLYVYSTFSISSHLLMHI